MSYEQPYFKLELKGTSEEELAHWIKLLEAMTPEVRAAYKFNTEGEIAWKFEVAFASISHAVTQYLQSWRPSVEKSLKDLAAFIDRADATALQRVQNIEERVQKLERRSGGAVKPSTGKRKKRSTKKGPQTHRQRR